MLGLLDNDTKALCHQKSPLRLSDPNNLMKWDDIEEDWNKGGPHFRSALSTIIKESPLKKSGK